MTPKKYTLEERIIAQNKSFELKRAGYNIERLVDENDSVVAFGYTKSDVPGLKKATQTKIYHKKESDYEFIYWN